MRRRPGTKYGEGLRVIHRQRHNTTETHSSHLSHTRQEWPGSLQVHRVPPPPPLACGVLISPFVGLTTAFGNQTTATGWLTGTMAVFPCFAPVAIGAVSGSIWKKWISLDLGVLLI